MLHGIGTLDLEDKELEELIFELDSILILDERSLWQPAAGKSPAATDAEGSDEEGGHQSYDQIDYDAIRQHPRVQQYLHSGLVGSHHSNRLQLILGSITDHFRGFMEPEATLITNALDEILAVPQAETEEEGEEEEQDRHGRRITEAQRTKRIFKNFIDRYLKGLSSSRFQQVVDPPIITKNYIVFSHLLLALSKKPWFEDEPEYLIDTLLRMWSVLWGQDGKPGYLLSPGTDRARRRAEGDAGAPRRHRPGVTMDFN